jgi:4-amino-4-deoxychorismate synthase (2-amino-4-deoxychorismate-forming) component I
MLLEDGRGSGLTHLVWGARHRWRRLTGPDYLPPAADPETAWYGVLAYEAGLPPWVDAASSLNVQPLSDWFVPENRLVLGPTGEIVRLDGPVAKTAWATSAALASLGGSAPVSVAAPPWRSFDAARFAAAVRRAQEYIAAGDIYQVNLAVAQMYQVTVTPWQAYARLRAMNPSPWMGFADFGDWQLVCGSPELLVELRPDAAGPLVRTRPIAGTRKKTGDGALDARMRTELRLDEKERAEHRMLVDLARNDVGRVAAYGSVVVAEQEVVEEYSHVFHLVSEVRGRLRPDAGIAEVVDALFPGGTITGCPKLRAMEIIRELEPVSRGAYTGALGWIGAKALQLNIVIRSAAVSGGRVVIQSGAGIVADSIPDREWRESLRKARAVRLAFGFGDDAE